MHARQVLYSSFSLFFVIFGMFLALYREIIILNLEICIKFGKEKICVLSNIA
jgi:hypothetical protein